eukprot:scaffold725_cov108-Skeletonema_menzelii.AAC.1
MASIQDWYVAINPNRRTIRKYGSHASLSDPVLLSGMAESRSKYDVYLNKNYIVSSQSTTESSQPSSNVSSVLHTNSTT